MSLGELPPQGMPTLATEDAGRFLDLVRAHRLVSVLGPVTADLGLEPPEQLRLQQATGRSRLEGELLALSTLRVCDVLTEARVPVIAFKGAGLAWHSTGDVAGRGGGDIDVIVPPACVPDAIEALAQAGGQVRAPSFRRPGDALWEPFMRLYNEFPVQFGAVEVDVHWRFDAVPEVLSLPFDDLASRTASVPVSGSSMPTLGTDDALLVAALHGTKERWQVLRRAIDLVRLSRRVTDFNAVHDQAEDCGVGSHLRLALCFCSWLDPAVSDLAQAFASKADWRRAQGCWQSLAQRRPAQVPATRTQALGQIAWQWSVMPGARARWHLVERSLIYFKDMERLRLPAALLPLYIPLRPVMSLLPDPVNGPRSRRARADVK